jgi:hypothetical protein
MSNCKIGIKAASGVAWEAVGTSPPTRGRELHSEQLAAALRRRKKFTTREWESFGITELFFNSFVRAADGVYHRPARVGDKTIVTGVRYDMDGRMLDIDDPKLLTVDGRLVPVREASFAYKHLGRFRCANADAGRGRKEFSRKFCAAVGKLAKIRFTKRRAFMLVSDALIGGSAGFHLQEVYLTFEEADKLEAKWRRVYNRVSKRDRSTPRAEIYAAKPVAGQTRRHLWSHGLAAVYTVVNASLSDVHDMEHRAVARAGLALSLHAWGCRASPANWDWSHLRVQLETALKHPHVRYLGDAWMLAVLVMLDAPTCSDGDAASNAAARDDKWRWTSALHHGDPLSPNAPHWDAPSSPLLSTAVTCLSVS